MQVTTCHKLSTVGGDPARQCWWYVTEITLDYLRPSPRWKKETEDLQLAKDCEAMIERGLETLAKRRRKEKEKLRMLSEVAELFKTAWPGQNLYPKWLAEKIV